MFLFKVFWDILKFPLVMTFLLSTLALTERKFSAVGDNIQIVLPAAAFVCSIRNKRWGSFIARFTGLEIVVHGSKYGLGDAPINIRPNGKDRGFPSGHAAAAAFGASSLIHSCIRKDPLMSVAILFATGVVGSARIEIGAHTAVQVLFGALIGFLMERSGSLVRRISGWRKFVGRFHAVFLKSHLQAHRSWLSFFTLTRSSATVRAPASPDKSIT